MLTMDVFTVICAWCNRIMSAQENDKVAKRCTHSICENCFEKIRIEIASIQTNLSAKTSAPTAKL